MQMQRVSSTDISAVGYESGTLYIEFHSSSTYSYANVPVYEYENLMSAGSHGKYFHSHIKNNYVATKL